MRFVGFIQARMGSTRLPGKAMLPLDGVPVLEHEIRRASSIELLDELVVATTTNGQDQILEEYVSALGYPVFRGGESDVLSRLTEAAAAWDADFILRLSGDNPVVPPQLGNRVLQVAVENGLEYCSNKLRRTLPIGVTAEAIDTTVLRRLDDQVTEPFYREHITPYFKDFAAELKAQNITAEEVCSSDFLDSYTKETLVSLRFTLDRAPDYKLLRHIYEGVPFDTILPFEESVDYVFSNGLEEVNANVDQEVL